MAVKLVHDELLVRGGLEVRYVVLNKSSGTPTGSSIGRVDRVPKIECRSCEFFEIIN